MKISLFVVLLSASILSGCYANARFYPVKGPLSAQAPLPVFKAKVTGIVKNGNISLVLADGEIGKGRWSQVGPVHAPKGATTSTASATSGMASLWDTVYGPGFYVSHVLGSRLYAEAVVTGDRGTVLNVEFYRGEGEEHENSTHAVKGVAKDNKDNIYKVVF
jgi:hypothetical protein